MHLLLIQVDEADDFGFDAVKVREQLNALLEKARYYIRYQNIEEAIFIVQKNDRDYS